MSSFLSRVLDANPKLAEWRSHLQAADRSVAKLRTAGAAAFEHHRLLAEARAEFTADPTPARCSKVMLLLSQTEAAAVTVNEIQGQIAIEKNSRIAAGRAKFLAAIDETRASLESAREKIIAEDATRSADLGEPVESSAPLESIGRKLAQLDRAAGYANADLEIARGAFRAVVGGEG